MVLYYTPLMIMKSWVKTESERSQNLATHEKLIEGWKSALTAAGMSSLEGVYSMHVNDEGDIELD